MDSDDELLITKLVNEDEQPDSLENVEDIVKLEVRDDEEEFAHDFEVTAVGSPLF